MLSLRGYRRKEDDLYIQKGRRERTSGPKGRMILLIYVRAKAHTYQPVPTSPCPPQDGL